MPSHLNFKKGVPKANVFQVVLNDEFQWRHPDPKRLTKQEVKVDEPVWLYLVKLKRKCVNYVLIKIKMSHYSHSDLVVIFYHHKIRQCLFIVRTLCV